MSSALFFFFGRGVVCSYFLHGLWRCLYRCFRLQVFTSVPPLAIGLFDRTVTSESMLKYPKLYKASQNAEIYNTKVRSYPMYFAKFTGETTLFGWSPDLSQRLSHWTFAQQLEVLPTSCSCYDLIGYEVAEIVVFFPTVVKYWQCKHGVRHDERLVTIFYTWKSCCCHGQLTPFPVATCRSLTSLEAKRAKL